MRYRIIKLRFEENYNHPDFVLQSIVIPNLQSWNECDGTVGRVKCCAARCQCVEGLGAEVGGGVLGRRW